MTIRNDYDTSSNVQLGSTWTYDTGSGGPNGACIGLLGSATATGNATVSGGYVRTQRYNSVCQPTATTVALGGTGGTTHSITDSYSTIGEYSGTAYPSGFSTSINYTAGSYISTITGTNPATGAQATLYTVGGRDASARPTSVVYGNNLTTNFKYDVGERVNSIVTSSASSTLLSMTYGWNSISDGKLGTRAQSGVIGTSNSYSLAEKFSYDTLNELTQVTNTATNSVETSFGYVQNSNGTPDGTFRLATKSDVGTYSYNSTTRPHAVRSIAGTVNGSFTYDAAGETLSDASGRTYQWFPFGLVNSVTQGSTTLSFSYDPEHRRIQMVAPEGTTRYYWSAHASIELTPNGTWQDYISGPDGLIGTGDGNASGYTIYYLHNDYQQSVTLESNSGGTAQAELAYDAWGKRRHPDGTPDTTDSLMNGSISDRNYIGEEALDDVSLMNLNVRLYDPYLGRFTTPDPSGQAGGINVFGYGGNDPISASDPTGLAADCPPGPDGIPSVCVRGTPDPPVPGLSLSDFNGFDLGVSDGFSDTSIMSIKIASKEGVTVSSGAPTTNNQSNTGISASPSVNNTTPGVSGVWAPGGYDDNVPSPDDNTPADDSYSDTVNGMTEIVAIGIRPPSATTVGSFQLAANTSIQVYNVNLLLHEAEGGHTIRRHVGKTISFLLRRLVNSNVPAASSFYNLQQATGVINKSLNMNAADIAAMLASPGANGMEIDTTFSAPIGYTISAPGGASVPASTLRMVLQSPALTPEGFLILTAYPTAP
jgi:RHS repeat-associated protein